MSQRRLKPPKYDTGLIGTVLILWLIGMAINVHVAVERSRKPAQIPAEKKTEVIRDK